MEDFWAERIFGRCNKEVEAIWSVNEEDLFVRD